VELTAAVIREQGVDFAVVLVTRQATQPGSREATARSMQPLFPGHPVVLCSQDSRGTPSYFGRRDLVQFLASVFMEQLPWKKYRSNAA
jgi:hypothetical protein